MRELVRTRNELHRSNEHLSLFAGQISHDLRNPLTAILGNAEQLAMEPVIASDERLRQMAEGAAAACERMEMMMDEALRYARLGGQLRLTDVDLSAVARSVVADLQPAISASGATVSLGELPVVRGDKSQLYAVLLNLVGNAVKFSRPGVPPRITVSSTQPRDGRVRVEVSDNGRGVAPESQGHVFTLFGRADDREPGSGIGLATAKRIIASHRGRIGMDSTPGAGTTVWFELPVPPALEP